MYAVLHNLLSDRKGGEIFVLFGTWHFFYLAITAAAIAALVFCLRRREDCARRKAEKALINIAFALYILDFFLMPLAYNEIDIEKLPFHACTAMCVMCFLSHRIPSLEKFRTSFAMLGFLSNAVYLVYPAGVMWHGVHPLSYRVIQTLIFHAVMTVYGCLTLNFAPEGFSKSLCRRDAAVVLGMTLWALLGNYVYNGSSDHYSHFFNWFFVVRDPFWLLPEEIAPFLMPTVNVFVFFGAEVLIRLLSGLRKRSDHDERKDSHVCGN